MIRAVVLIPVRDNAGQPYPHSLWDELDQRLTAFGGYTRSTGHEGVWQDAGRLYRDVSHQYVVALQSWGDLAEWLTLVRWARAAFRQEALYIEVAGIPEIWRG